LGFFSGGDGVSRWRQRGKKICGLRVFAIQGRRVWAKKGTEDKWEDIKNQTANIKITLQNEKSIICGEQHALERGFV